MVQWLGFDVSLLRAQVHSLVRELRSCKPCGAEGERGRGRKSSDGFCLSSVIPSSVRDKSSKSRNT